MKIRAGIALAAGAILILSVQARAQTSTTNGSADGASGGVSLYNSSDTGDGSESVVPIGATGGANTTMGQNTDIGANNVNLSRDANGMAAEGLAATSRNTVVAPTPPTIDEQAAAAAKMKPYSANIYGAGGMAGPDAASP